MKIFLNLLVIGFVAGEGPSYNWSKENRDVETKQVLLWNEKLVLVRGKTPLERISELSLGLRNMGYRKGFEGHSPAVDVVYGAIQSEMLSIPGHAWYLAGIIEQEQKAVVSYPTSTGPRVSYDFNRAKHFGTLSHLPSPESIAVLGHFLSDDKDTPVPLRSPKSDWGDNPRANSYFSSTTIMNIGLRNRPVDPSGFADDPDTRLAKTRAWWDEIKSGRKTFSFVGQNVEYRFKPDGTWETLAMAHPPNDAPDGKGAVTTDKLAEPRKVLDIETASEKGSAWPWILISTMLALAALVWAGVRFSS